LLVNSLPKLRNPGSILRRDIVTPNGHLHRILRRPRLDSIFARRELKDAELEQVLSFIPLIHEAYADQPVVKPAFRIKSRIIAS
jgi:hypothetical protein